MRSELRKQVAEIAARLGSPTIMGIWTHAEDGTPVRHQLAGRGLNLERWFRTGKLPKSAEFCAVMAMPDKDRYWSEDRGDFAPTPEEMEAGWEPFPELHPDTLEQLRRMREMAFYSFIDGEFRGMNGPLPPNEQRRELYPHG